MYIFVDSSFSRFGTFPHRMICLVLSLFVSVSLYIPPKTNRDVYHVLYFLSEIR
jgi:hypothetical protein